MRSILLLLPAIALSVSAACTDRLTGPEALELVQKIERTLSTESPETRWGPREQLWGTLGWYYPGPRLPRGSTVSLRRDNRPLTYGAAVFERVLAPTGGPAQQDSCLGTRWSLFLWREGGRPDGIVFFGGRFDVPLGIPPSPCSPTWRFWNPEPRIFVHPAPNSSNEAKDVTGDGEISPGVVVSDCIFLEPEAFLFFEQEGITCELTRHRVRLRAQVKLRDGATLHLELQPAEVFGFRWTYHCDTPARAAEYCADWP